MDNNRKIPNIRFAGFTDAWEQRELGSLGKVLTGNTPPTSDLDNWSSDENCHVWITPTDIDSLIMSNSDRHLTDKGWKIARTIPENSVLITSIASIGKNAINTVPVAFNQQINAIVPEGNDAYFILSVMERDTARFASLAGQTATAIINKSTFEKFQISIPTYNEQVKVGGFFKDLDNLITLHQRECDLLVKTKKSYLQKMFPKNGEDKPEIRFEGFTEAWEQRELSDVSEKVIEKNKDNLFSETLTNSAEHGIIDQRDFFDKNISNEKNLDGYYVVRENDFVYNPRISNFAPVGPIKRNKLGRTGVMSPLYYVFRTKEIDNSYLEYFFENTTWHKFMKLNGDSGARSDRFAIKDSVFKGMPIPYPSLSEQEKIGKIFDGLTCLITLHQRELNSLKDIKKSLLQQMFV